MLAEQTRQDLITHDIANASTPGYKPDRTTTASFSEMLLRNSSTGETIGSIGFGARIEKQVTDLRPGGLRETGEPLDFAVEGEGFFAVRSAKGVRYTRDGQFQVSSRGGLVTTSGDEVLGAGGQPVRVGDDGTVRPNEIGVTQLDAPKREGENLFTGTARGAAKASVRGGALESSSVDPITAMTDMIGSLRVFEAGQRVITTIDSTLAKAANTVGMN